MVKSVYLLEKYELKGVQTVFKVMGNVYLCSRFSNNIKSNFIKFIYFINSFYVKL